MLTILVLFIFLDLLGRWSNYLTLYNSGVIMYIEVKERLQKKKQQNKKENKMTNINLNQEMTVMELDDLTLGEFDYSLFDQDWEDIIFNQGNLAIDLDGYNYLLYSFNIVKEDKGERENTIIKITNIEEI